MSARMLDSYEPWKRGAGSEMGRPHGRFYATRKVLFTLLAFFVLTLIPLTASAKRRPAPEGEDAVAAYIVKETGSPEFLKSKNADTPRSPASLTKIMTCLLAIESGRMNDVVTIPLEATQVEPTRAGFKPGEQFRLRDLVKAAMVNSSNDAAFAIAIHLGGSLDAFVAMMNARARALGMSHTVFTNPAGYDRGIYAGNRTTARDLVILTERAIRFPEFNAIAKLDRVDFNELSTGKIYSLRTHNKLLERYPYSVGIKTGYTSMAGPCLIARALRNGKDMLVIMLSARTDRWSLASTMFDQGFGLDAGPVQVAETAEKSPRRVAVDAPEAPHSSVSVRRAQALEALRLKVESRRGQSAVTEIRGMSMNVRSSGADSSVKARMEKRKASAVIKLRGKSSRADRIALRAGKNASARRKQQLAMARQRNHKNGVVLKSAKKNASGNVALKSHNKAQRSIKTARKGAVKRSTADAKSAKSRSWKEGLSLSERAVRSPNG